MKRFVAFAMIAFALGACSTGSKYDYDEKEFLEAPAFLEVEILDRIANMEYLAEEELYQNIVRLVYIGEAAIPYMIDGLTHDSARVRGHNELFAPGLALVG